MKKYLFATIMLVTVMIFASKVNASGFYAMLEVNIPSSSSLNFYNSEVVYKETDSDQYMKTVYVGKTIHAKIYRNKSNVSGGVNASKTGLTNIMDSTGIGGTVGNHILKLISLSGATTYTGNGILDEYLIK